MVRGIFIEGVTFKLELEGRPGFGYSESGRDISYQKEQRSDCQWV